MSKQSSRRQSDTTTSCEGPFAAQSVNQRGGSPSISNFSERARCLSRTANIRSEEVAVRSRQGVLVCLLCLSTSKSVGTSWRRGARGFQRVHARAESASRLESTIPRRCLQRNSEGSGVAVITVAICSRRHAIEPTGAILIAERLSDRKRWKQHKKCGKCRCAHGNVPFQG
jgi:hypothetical protein